jgi:ankyrin repeat protein/predicted nucleotidyltransferase
MFTELQEGIKAYLDQHQYDKALSKWDLVQKSIEKLPTSELQEHIHQAHALAKNFLATQQTTKADDLYEHLKKACLQLDQFSILEQVQFYQAVASNYEAHGKHNEALSYCMQALYLAEQDTQTDFINLLMDKLNQLHHKLLAQLIVPYVKQQIETKKDCLYVAKQRSLEEFTAVANNVLLLANVLQQEQQWELAISCYETVVSEAQLLAETYPIQPLITKITELSRYDRGETKPTELSHWQTYRQQLHALRERFSKQLAIQSIITVQAIFSRDLKNLLADVLKQIESLLGEKPCAFSFIVLGSLAREDACPYSDIDFAILVSDEKERHDDYFQALIRLFSLSIHLIGEPNGLRIDSGDLGYLSGADKLFLTTSEKLAKRFSPAKYQNILDQPETHALHRPALLYASTGGEDLLTNYQKLLQREWPTYRAQWVSGYARLHYNLWLILGKKTNERSTVDLKQDYLRPLLLWCTDIALHAGIEVVSINELLQTLAVNQVLDTDFLKELTAAFSVIQKLRIALQLQFHTQEGKLNIFNNMNAGLELEKIRSQILTPAYECLVQLETQPEKQLKQFDPIAEHLLQAIDQPAAVVPMASTSSSSSSTSSMNVVSFFKPASPLIIEQTIQTFIEVMLQRGGKTSEQRNKHRAMYGKLSPKLRAFYLKQLEAGIAEAVQAQKLDQKTADTTLQTLYRYPDSSGIRKSSANEMALWEITLLNLTEPASQNPQTMTVTFEWLTSRGQKEKRILKSYYVDQVWGNQGKLGGHDKSSDGRRLVRPLQDPSGKLVVYVKVYPELPGIQLSVNSLVQHISGEGMKSTVVKATTVTGKSTTTYPLLLSEPVPGKTLQQLLREQGHLNDIETKLDPKGFTLKVFESLLINPEDDKADNLVAEPATDLEGNTGYRIVSVDSDHAYVDPLIQAGTLINRQEKVQVKSMLYCMGAMLHALDPEAIQEFLLLDPFQTLNDWLSGLHVYNQRHVGNRELNQTGLLTETEIQNYSEGKDFCFIQTFFEPGWVVAMYEKFLRLQAALRENPPNNHLELLMLIEPRLAVYYEETFEKHTTAHERFQSLPTEYVTVSEKQTSTVRYQSILKAREKVLKSITIIDQKKKKDLKVALREGGLFTPEKAQKMELQTTYERYQRIQNVRAQIMQGSLEAFTQIEYGDFFKEKVVNGLDFNKLSESLAICLLEQLPNSSFFSLSLIGCHYLTDELLKAILKGSPSLQELDVSDCVQLTDASFYAIAKHCRHIVKLAMANTNLKTLKSRLGRTVEFSTVIKFNALKKLRLSRCRNLTTVGLDAPCIMELYINECQDLESLAILGFPTTVNTQGCKKLEMVAGMSSFHIAAKENNVEKLQEFLEKGANVEETTIDGRTSLYLAAQEGNLMVLQRLLQVRANVDPNNKQGLSPLWMAAKRGQVEVTQMLIKAGAKVDQVSNKIGLPILYHVRGQVYECDAAPLFIAILTRANGNIEIVQLLLKGGANVDQTCKVEVPAGIKDVRWLGKDCLITPLFMAASRGRADIVKVLLAYNAQVDYKTFWGTALKIAQERNNTIIVDLLNEYSKNPVAKKQEYRREVDEQTDMLLARIDKTLLESEQRVNEIITKAKSNTSSSPASYSTTNLIAQHSPIISASTGAMSSSLPLTTDVVQTDAVGEPGMQNASTFGK